MSIKFEFLQAGQGDSILISIDDYRLNILIDGGQKNTYNEKSIFNLKDKIEKDIRDNEKKLNLVVMTHYDNDHIGGIINLLKDEEENIKKGKDTIIKNLWFNTFDKALIETEMIDPKTAAKEQIQFDTYLKKILKKIDNYKPRISIDDITESIFIGENKEIELILLSPNDEKLDLLYKKDFEPHLDDKSISKSDYGFSIDELSSITNSAEDGSHRNGSSIAFILIYDKMKFLFLGDAHIGLIVESLKNLDKKYFNGNGLIEFEFVKLSHHGSIKNINENFLDLIRTDKYIISTSRLGHNHPDKKTISAIVNHKNRERIDDEYKEKIYFFCNYDYEAKVFSVKEQKKYKSPFKFLSRDIKNAIKSQFQENLEYRLG